MMNLPGTNKRYAIGVDLGGTKLAVAVVDSEGEIQHQRKTAVLKDHLSATADQIASLSSQALKATALTWSDVVAVGVCIPGIYFAGEVLDIDGITGGFNFQAAWTTGFIAGRVGIIK